MACGQKKQNNQEGGVHLTERTCSPYNPIIKQIVDDCLGLPIYPVSSIDAVIDEDGNTLRKLLDELVNQINGGQSNLTEIIRQIQLAITTIEGNYLTEQDLNNVLSGYATTASLNSLSGSLDSLKSLLWAISALTDTSNVNTLTPSDLYKQGTNTPKIVAAVDKLHQDINDIIGGSGGNGVSLASLNEAIGALRSLLLAVANFDTAAHNEEGLTHYANNQQIKIIKEIIDLKSALGIDPENPGDGTLAARISALEGSIQALVPDVNSLKEASKIHAHLDARVLSQMPDGEVDEAIYQTLRAEEVPPTTIQIITIDLKDDPRRSGRRFEYLGELINDRQIVIENLPDDDTRQRLKYYDTLPVGHKNAATGYPLFIWNESTEQYEGLQDLQGDQLYAGNGKVTKSDYFLINEMILHPELIPPYEYEPKGDTPKCNELFYKKDGLYYPYGDVNGDGEVHNADTVALIRALFEYSTQSSIIGAQPEIIRNKNQGWLHYYTNTSLDPVAIYPCIEGRLYIDEFTGNLYKFQEGTMYPVNKTVFKAGENIELSAQTLFTDAKGEINYGPYNELTINAVVPTLAAGDNINISTDEQTNTVTFSTPAYTEGTGVNISNKVVSIDATSFPTQNILEPQSDNDLYKLSIEGHQLNLNVVPTIMYLKPEPEPDPNPQIQSSESSIHPIEGQYYVTIDQQRIKVLPDELDDRTEYNVKDLSVLIDRLLNGVIYTTTQQDILDTLLYNVLERFNLFNDSQLDLLTTIKESIQETQPEIQLQSSVDRVFTYYIEDDDNPHQAFGTYADVADNGTYDFDGDNTVGVSDVTSFIDDLMQGNDLSIRYNQRQVGATLYQYKNGDYVQIGVVPLDKENYETQSLRGVIFQLMDQYNEEAWTWYYFDEEGSFIPMFPDLYMKYDSSESKLILGTLKKQLAQCTLPINSKDNSSPNPSPGNANDISPIKVHSTNFLGASESSQLQAFHGMQLPEQDLPVFHPTTLREDTFAGQVQVKAIAHLNYNVAEYDGSQTQSNQKFIDLINQTKSARYYKCFDLMSQELIYALEIISFEVIDPNEAEENDVVVTVGDNVTVKIITDVEVIRSFDIQDDVLYNIPQYGLTVKFTHENNSLIPIIVSVEHRKAPESRITDTAAKTTAMVYPNEFLEISTITSDKLTFDISHLTQAIEPDLISVRGTFVGKDNLEISFYEPDSQYVITSLSSNPTPETGKMYGYEIFNRTFKLWELYKIFN